MRNASRLLGLSVAARSYAGEVKVLCSGAAGLLVHLGALGRRPNRCRGRGTADDACAAARTAAWVGVGWSS